MWSKCIRFWMRQIYFSAMWDFNLVIWSCMRCRKVEKRKTKCLQWGNSISQNTKERMNTAYENHNEETSKKWIRVRKRNTGEQRITSGSQLQSQLLRRQRSGGSQFEASPGHKKKKKRENLSQKVRPTQKGAVRVAQMVECEALNSNSKFQLPITHTAKRLKIWVKEYEFLSSRPEKQSYEHGKIKSFVHPINIYLVSTSATHCSSPGTVNGKKSSRKKTFYLGFIKIYGYWFVGHRIQ
jgi:hypothetical protein